MLRVQTIKGRTITVELWDESAPAPGRQFEDPRGNLWIVRGVSEAPPAFVNPPPPVAVRRWLVTLAHDRYTPRRSSSEGGPPSLSSGDDLRPIWRADEIRAARDLVREQVPEVLRVAVEGDNERLVVVVPNEAALASVPGTVNGIPTRAEVGQA